MEGSEPSLLGELLTYVPEFSIIICKLCRFAIQPKALSSHLLRHQIYRNNRQQILDYVSGLGLLEPSEVPVPPADTQPFVHLPVFSGYACNFPACHHLCISQKRMGQHLREQHGENASVNSDSRPVHLQTFFRGNKNRYFQVRSDEPPATTRLEPPTPREASGQELHSNETTPTSSSDTMYIDKAATSHLDMPDLMYLHRYITWTGHTVTRGNESIQFWTHTLPQQAPSQPYLMHGMLGVAAFHQACLSFERKERRLHQQAGLIHQSAGLEMFRIAMDHPSTQNCTALIAFARLLGIQSCAQALLVADASSLEDEGTSASNIAHILEFLSLNRGGCELLLSMQDLLPIGSEFILPAAIRQGLDELSPHQGALQGPAPYIIHELYSILMSKTLRLSSYGDMREIQELSKLSQEVSKIPWAEPITEAWVERNLSFSLCSKLYTQELTQCLKEARKRAEPVYNLAQINHTPAPLPPPSCYPQISPALYSHLSSLPQQLTSKVTSFTNFELEACVTGVAALLTSFSRSHAADRIWALWNGIESWPRMLPDSFLSMIENAHPFALVLVAHWSTLIKKQEEFYWFLGGQSKRLMGVILSNLEPELQEFVRDCLETMRQAES